MAESSHNSSTRSYNSLPVSTISPGPPSRYLGGFHGASSRPSPSSSPQHQGMPTLPSINKGFPPYGSVTSRESLHPAKFAMGAQGSNHGCWPAVSGVQAQKRAYRQRRRNPSCDVCRERKVKCDATETTSCSECSCRNIKCQFTEPTNSSMSAIKQVQILETRIELLRRENTSLRCILEERNGQINIDLDAAADRLSAQLPKIEVESKQRKRHPPNPELPRARANVLNLAKGIWQPPALHCNQTAAVVECATPELPPQAVTEYLLNSFCSSAHMMFPIIHMPKFQYMVNELYRAHPSRVSSAWISLFFAVLAVGSIFSPKPPTATTFYQTAEFLESARNTMNPWNNRHNIDDARALVLITICLNEMNLKSAAWNWFGNAVRVAQELGLYSESGSLSAIECEMRRSTWWSIYILDRTMAMEMGHPYLIDDADCDVSLPAAVDDQYFREDRMQVRNGAEPSTHSLLAVIHVVQSYTSMMKALQGPALPPAELSMFEGYLTKCLRNFPPECDPSSTVALASNVLAPLAYIFHFRLLLHRHNLSLNCPSEVRLAAVTSCTHIALETESLISRTKSLADGATTLLTAHIFRSTLFLLLTGYLDHANTCIRALASIDARRGISISSCRFLAFFVTTLGMKLTEHGKYWSSRLPSDQSALLLSLTGDDELLACISSDLQTSPKRSWVWSPQDLDSIPPKAVCASRGHPSSNGNGLFSSEQRSGLNEERRDWVGWPMLESMAQNLGSANSYCGSLPPQQVKRESPIANVDLSKLSQASRFAVGHQGNTSPPAMNRVAERISIANIIC